MNEIWELYRGPIIGSLIGFLIALLLLTLGFFKTMLLVILIIIGSFAGWYVTMYGWKILHFLSNKRK